MTTEDTRQLWPVGAVWAFCVALGLIGTIATGAALSNDLASTTVGGFGVGSLTAATLFAFFVAYVEASELDRREGQR
ncbi:hypothetical protein [Halorubrum sp. DM2]|uniref:hypothetical protein n=1 Tax=Halorubrum sp. DM2 TaxID=2527867 RepID=UPI0024B66492|nr:hypothetical protein [Halorubrum sp. DM2]